MFLAPASILHVFPVTVLPELIKNGSHMS